MKKPHSKIHSKYEKSLGSVERKFPLKRWSPGLKKYSPFNWYLLKQVELYLNLEASLPKLSIDPKDFGAEDDRVFEIWNRSEFAGEFLNHMNRGNSLRKATELTLKNYKEHIKTLGDRYLLDKHEALSKSYRIQISLGERKIGSRISQLKKKHIVLDGTLLTLMAPNAKEMKDFSTRIITALGVIKTYSPDSWERFQKFTNTIIPIKQSEFVSYSHQELPGYSMINLYDRDFVDLMDDLLHENGHHHLNYHLNVEKLIDEPIDCIYYSPWRRTLRPLRGIYHAYFTFFWAFELFSDLASTKNLRSGPYQFNQKEIEKIYFRAVEEYWMLKYSFKDLEWAKTQGLINSQGWDLIQKQNKRLKKMARKIPVWEKKLKAHARELKDLKKTLEQARLDYQIEQGHKMWP